MDNKKKVGIAVFCLAVAGFVVWVTNSDDSDRFPDVGGQKTWVKCNNPDCNAAYEVALSDYYKDLKEKLDKSTESGIPALTCKNCGKDTLCKGLKCENCGAVFIEGGDSPIDYADRCSNCKISKLEQKRNKASK